MKYKFAFTLLVFVLGIFLNLNAEACSDGTLSTCLSGGVGGLQVCRNGQLGPCTVPPSQCGGTKPHDSLIKTTADNGSGTNMGLLCGAATAENKQCYSCAAQWVYPSAPVNGGTIECRCL